MQFHVVDQVTLKAYYEASLAITSDAGRASRWPTCKMVHLVGKTYHIPKRLLSLILLRSFSWTIEPRSSGEVEYGVGDHGEHDPAAFRPVEPGGPA